MSNFKIQNNLISQDYDLKILRKICLFVFHHRKPKPKHGLVIGLILTALGMGISPGISDMDWNFFSRKQIISDVKYLNFWH